jgi:hypothetical protein
VKRYVFCFILILVFIGVFHIASAAQDASDQATDDARIFLLHGVPGADLGEDATFPVDIYIDGIKKVSGMKYGQIKGQIKITPGVASIAAYRAGMGPEAGYDALKEETFIFLKNEAATVVAYLPPESESPRLIKFTNDFSPATDPSKNRIIVHNTSSEATLGVLLANKGAEPYPSLGSLLLEPGDKFSGEIAKKGLYGAKKAFSWQLSLMVDGKIDHPFYNKPFVVKPGQATLLYIVGSTMTKTFKLIKRNIKLS